MTTKKDSGSSALAKFAESGYDVVIGFSRLYANEIALDVLLGVADAELKKIRKDVRTIFEQWKLVFGKRNTTKRLVQLDSLKAIGDASFIDEPQTEKERLKNIKNKHPWQCCRDVSTPIGLFRYLFADGYKPLMKYLNQGPNNYERIVALLILDSNQPRYPAADCIEAAFKLASYRIEGQKSFIKKSGPAHEARYRGQKNSAAVRKAQLDKIDEIVARAYYELCKDGRIPPIIQSKVIVKTKLKQWTVSRSFDRLGLRKNNHA